MPLKCRVRIVEAVIRRFGVDYIPVWGEGEGSPPPLIPIVNHYIYQYRVSFSLASRMSMRVGGKVVDGYPPPPPTSRCINVLECNGQNIVMITKKVVRNSPPFILQSNSSGRWKTPTHFLERSIEAFPILFFKSQIAGYVMKMKVNFGCTSNLTSDMDLYTSAFFECKNIFIRDLHSGLPDVHKINELLLASESKTRRRDW